MGEGTKTLPRKERVVATVDSKRAEEESCQQRCTHDPDDSDKEGRPPLKKTLPREDAEPGEGLGVGAGQGDYGAAQFKMGRSGPGTWGA